MTDFRFNSLDNIFIAIHIAILEVWFKRIILNNSIKFDILSPYSTFLFLFISQESVLSCVFCIFAQIIIKI